MRKEISKLITLFVLLSFLFIVGFGLSHSFGMEMKDDGTMGGCMFDGRAELCPMTLAEHISNWQSMFSAIPQKSYILAQLSALVFALILAAFVLGRHSSLSPLNYFSGRRKRYVKNNSRPTIFDPIREALSSGILNPKIYGAAAL